MDKSLSGGTCDVGGSIKARENNEGFQPKPVRFLADMDINGVHLLEDSSLGKMLQKRLRTFNHGSSTSSSIFPATLPVPITTFNQLMEDGGSFVFSPKPLGIRYLFYFDKEGRSFLMNSTQHIFKVAKSCAFRVIPPETVLDGIVVRKIVRSERSNQEASNGKLTFVIMDATRINGVDLTQKSIQERMSIVQARIMQPRQLGITKKIIRADRDVFDLEMTKYEDLSRMEDYLTQESNDSYPFPRRSFVFYPTVGTYACGNDGKRILEWEDTKRDMLVPAAKEFK